MAPFGSAASERRTIALSAALVAATIGVLVAASLALDLERAARGGLAGVALAGAALAGVLVAVGDRSPTWLVRGVPVVLAVLVGGAIASGGAGAEAYSWLFALVVLHTCVVLPLRWAAPVLLLCLGADVVGLLAADGRTQDVHWIIGPATVLVGGLLANRLVTLVRENAADALAAGGLGRTSPGSGDVGSAACEALAAATSADVCVMLELLDGAGGMQVTGMVGSPESGMVFTRDEVRGALEACVRTGEPQELRAADVTRRPALLGSVRPVLVDSAPVGVLAFAWTRPRRRLPRRAEPASLLVAAEAGVALDLVAQADRDRERLWLEVNDAIVQGLAVAKMAIQAGQSAPALAALDDTLVRARDLISQQVERVSGRGGDALRPGDLLRTEGVTVAAGR